MGAVCLADRRDVLQDQKKSGSPFTTDLERFNSRGPRIKDLRDLFVTLDRRPQSKVRTFSADRDPGVNTAENDDALNVTGSRSTGARALPRAPAVTPIRRAPGSRSPIVVRTDVTVRIRRTDDDGCA